MAVFSQPVKVLGIWGEGRNRQKDEARDFQIQAYIKVITQNEKDPEKYFWFIQPTARHSLISK